jgi:hypothetical protein
MSAPAPTPCIADVTTLPLLTSGDCAALFRVPELFLCALRAGWLKPCARRHKIALYARADVDACIARIRAGEMPPARGRNNQPEPTP